MRVYFPMIHNTLSIGVIPPIFFVALVHVIEQNLPTLFAVSVTRPETSQKRPTPAPTKKNVPNSNSPVLVLHLLLDVGQILRRNVPLQILGELLRGSFQVLLIILEYHRLIILAQVVREHVRAHQRLAALAQNVDGLLQKLDLRGTQNRGVCFSLL